MLRVALFDPTCLNYRVNIYEIFIEKFIDNDIELKIYYDKNKTSINRDNFIGIEYSWKSFLALHKSDNVDISIFFIWLSYIFTIPFLLYNKLFLTTKIIVWSKGINITNINQPIKNQLYYFRQRLADALIIYTEYERRFIKASQDKVFVANNTVNQYSYELDSSNDSLTKLKTKYRLNDRKSVIFVGRIEERKKLERLVEVFLDPAFKEFQLLIIGPGLDTELNESIVKTKNIKYLGSIYDMNILSRLYRISDVFCMPGHIGLGLNEAFLFNLPVVTENIKNHPSLLSSEIMLLFEDGVNGLYYDGSVKDLKAKLLYLLSDESILTDFGNNALETFNKKGKIEYMYDAFVKSINYVANK